jgi:hypothetical protein
LRDPHYGGLRSFDEPRGDGICNSKPNRYARTDAHPGPYTDSSSAARRTQRLYGQ